MGTSMEPRRLDSPSGRMALVRRRPVPGYGVGAGGGFGGGFFCGRRGLSSSGLTEANVDVVIVVVVVVDAPTQVPWCRNLLG